MLCVCGLPWAKSSYTGTVLMTPPRCKYWGECQWVSEIQEYINMIGCMATSGIQQLNSVTPANLQKVGKEEVRWEINNSEELAFSEDHSGPEQHGLHEGHRMVESNRIQIQ